MTTLATTSATAAQNRGCWNAAPQRAPRNSHISNSRSAMTQIAATAIPRATEPLESSLMPVHQKKTARNSR
jgi:hypothetical protein